MEDNEVVESSVNTEDTSASESTSQVEASGAEKQDAAPEVKQEEKPIPFHEHPRWKELIEERNGFKSQQEEYKQTLGRLQRELDTMRQQSAPKVEPKLDPFLEDLRKVNPEYAKSMESVYKRAEMAEQAMQRIQQYETQQFANQARSHFDNILNTAKITDPVDKELYTNVVEAEVYRREQRGEKLGLNDLDKIFNQFHSKYAKAMEDRERAITAKYVQGKKSDTSPKGATGGAATTPGFKKIAANDFEGQTKWLADQIRAMKKTI